MQQERERLISVCTVVVSRSFVIAPKETIDKTKQILICYPKATLIHHFKVMHSSNTISCVYIYIKRNTSQHYYDGEE